MVSIKKLKVAPHAGAWIETRLQMQAAL